SHRPLAPARRCIRPAARDRPNAPRRQVPLLHVRRARGGRATIPSRREPSPPPARSRRDATVLAPDPRSRLAEGRPARERDPEKTRTERLRPTAKGFEGESLSNSPSGSRATGRSRRAKRKKPLAAAPDPAPEE